MLYSYSQHDQSLRSLILLVASSEIYGGHFNYQIDRLQAWLLAEMVRCLDLERGNQGPLIELSNSQSCSLASQSTKKGCGHEWELSRLIDAKKHA